MRGESSGWRVATSLILIALASTSVWLTISVLSPEPDWESPLDEFRDVPSGTSLPTLVKVVAIDPEARTVDLSVAISIGTEFEPISDPQGRAVHPTQVSGKYSLVHEYRTVAEVSPKDLNSVDDAKYPATVTVKLQAGSATPQLFPDDRYRVSPSFRLNMPEGYTVTGSDKYFLSLSVQPVRNEALADWKTVVISTDRTWSADIDLRRPSNVRRFVYGVAITPLLLGLAAVATWLRQRDAGRVPFELAVAILALLPLRSVLTPNDVPGITRLDTILGAELVFVAAIVTLMAVVALFRNPPSPNHLRHGGPPGRDSDAHG